MTEKLNIDGHPVSIKEINQEDYLSLTDMARKFNPDRPSTSIEGWMKNNSTIRFLALWEQLHNPGFNSLQMEGIKNIVAENGRYISAKQFIELTNAIGIQARAGRYGGTFAHADIAFEFASWLSPEFKLYLIKEFKRLKSEESQRNKLEWSTSRFLSKINYTLQTDAIETNLIPRLEGREKSLAYATEADLINLALFGQTAKQWRIDNPEIKGNIRDHASITQLIVLSNLETHNSYLIKAGASKEARFARLCEIAESQLEIFSKDKRLNDDKKFLE